MYIHIQVFEMLIQRMIVFSKCNNLAENRDISEIINALINKE